AVDLGHDAGRRRVATPRGPPRGDAPDGRSLHRPARVAPLADLTTVVRVRAAPHASTHDGHDRARLHYHPHPAKRPDIAGRVAVHGDQVGRATGGDDAK